MADKLQIYTALSEILAESDLPASFIVPEVSGFLDELAVLVYDQTGGLSDLIRPEIENDEDTAEPPPGTPDTDETPDLLDFFNIYLRLKVMRDLRFTLPFLKGVALVLGAGDDTNTGLLDVNLHMENRAGVPPLFDYEMRTTTLSLNIGNELLTPVDIRTENGVKHAIPRAGETISIPLPFTLRVRYDTAWHFNLESPLGEVTLVELPPCLIANTGMVLEKAKLYLNLSDSEKCLLLQWTEPNLGGWLQNITPGLSPTTPTTPTEMTARIVLGDPIQEILVEWKDTAADPGFRLPGVKVKTPSGVRYSLVLGNDPTISANEINRLSFILTQASGSQTVASSTFAWGRDGERELQNEKGQAQSDSLFQLTLTAQNPADTQISLVLLSINLKALALPTFLRQLETPLPELVIPAAGSTNPPTDLCQVIGFANRSLDDKLWKASFILGLANFKLPFLERPGDATQPSAIEQFIRVDRPDGNVALDVSFPDRTIGFPVNITVKIGPLEFKGEYKFFINWETLALTFDHGAGIQLLSSAATFAPDQTLLGLKWSFKGAPLQVKQAGVAVTKYHYFTLVTKDYHYQIQQAPDSSIELAYDGISSDPVRFIVTNFVLDDKGISLETKVSDQPVRLNGIDTKFRFDGSGIVIKNSQIESFTLAGSGALPPALVGDSRATIALQFGRRADGNLTLLSGEAELKGSKLLHCQGTRFQFAIDAIGLKFVNDGKFHLYFTLTGSAQFVLAAGDDKGGALALLPKIKVDLIECPLTGDASVIGKHIKFLIELPKPLSFNFLGCFEMELRGIGFVPQAEVFHGDGAMQLTGQLKFAQGIGDTPDSRTDYHNLLIGLPEKGHIFPRIYFKSLAVNLNIGAAFKLNGVVDFLDEENEKGFIGEGVLEIQGLPTMAASFGFLRVRRDEVSPWLRAWFIYLEVRQISFMIPVVEIYLREVGLGFGYRFTIASIKAADRASDVRQLLAELTKLSRTQGDLSKRDRWEVDLEDPGQDPRWTIVLRAMISQTSASPSPLSWQPDEEANLSCIFLFDAIIAFRSDFTFFMAVRGWFNTNYHDYVTDKDGIRNKPLLTGFVLLSPRQKRFLAHVASNPDGKLGVHPPLPAFVRSAIESVQFSATLLIEPGLLHYELGWPNMLRWKGKLGPLEVEFRGGFIFRISQTELMTGTSFMARGTLNIEAGFSAGFFGVSISAFAQIAYGARYIGVLAFKDVTQNSAFYGAIGLELYIKITIKFWIKLLFFKKSFGFSLSIGFTAALEVGLLGTLEPGIRGQGTLSFKVMGHGIRFGVKIGVNTHAVDEAIRRTEKFLHVGLEATEVDTLPGLSPLPEASAQFVSRARLLADQTAALDVIAAAELTAPDYTIFVLRKTDDECYFVLLPAGERKQQNADYGAEPGFLPAPPAEKLFDLSQSLTPADLDRATTEGISQALVDEFANQKQIILIKNQVVVTIRAQNEAGANTEWLISDHGTGERHDYRVMLVGNQLQVYGVANVSNDFSLDFGDVAATLPTTDFSLEQFSPWLWQQDSTQPIAARGWLDRTSEATAGSTFAWKAHWLAVVGRSENAGDPPDPGKMLTLADYLRTAFVERIEEGTLKLYPPTSLSSGNVLSDERVQNPTDDAFEAAVRGAFEQFQGSPFFKHDPNSAYSQKLAAAFSQDTSIYGTSNTQETAVQEHTDQIRGIITHDIIADLRAYVDKPNVELVEGAVGFQMGLVFRVRGRNRPAWLDDIVADGKGLKLHQRVQPEDTAVTATVQQARAFNPLPFSFAANPPRFDKVRHYTDAGTIALAWDLVWNTEPRADCTPSQVDPEHHLLHYQVRRRALSSEEREQVYTIKIGEVLHGKNSLETRLRPRFQVVDHFGHETAEDLAALPATGRSYLYTITPFDFAGNAGRPLTLVATRYPNEAPQVPVNGELLIAYKLAQADTFPVSSAAHTPTTPPVILPQQVEVQWSEPRAAQTGPQVAIAHYQVIFRRERTLPIGSYGLDSTTQRPRTNALPSSNARTRPTDIIVRLEPTWIQGARQARRAAIPLTVLQTKGILPPTADLTWRPEAWHIFFQTVASSGVPSALAPVQLLLRVQGASDAETAREERRPAELEWLPKPIELPLLPPEDQKATSGLAHFPMPPLGMEVGAFQFNGNLDPVAYTEHPAGLRSIRFRWNQGPSQTPDYPLALNAGYQLLELDIDAHTDDTLQQPEKVADVLRTIQEVQMLPADDLWLAPNDTLTTSQWEAWYPSTMIRRARQAQAQTGSQAVQGTQTVFSSWFSWRESYLVWPDWPGLTNSDNGQRKEALHPFLNKLVDALRFITDPVTSKPKERFIVDRQISPPIQPMTFADLRRTTAPASDPYGWGILQRLGLSVTLALHKPESGELVTDENLLTAVQAALAGLPGDAELAKHVHVEVLFQPGKSIDLQDTSVNATSLLGIIQISLRPRAVQRLHYSQLHLRGVSGMKLDLSFNLTSPCSLIIQTARRDKDQNNTDPTELALASTGKPLIQTITLPVGGETTLLLRSNELFTSTGSQALTVKSVTMLLQNTLSVDEAKKLPGAVQYIPAAADKASSSLLFTQSPATFDATTLTVLNALLSKQDQKVVPTVAQLFAAAPEEFAPTSKFATYFIAPVAIWATEFTQGTNPVVQKQWLNFQRYVETLNSSGRQSVAPANEPRIEIPTDTPDNLKKDDLLAEFMAWTQRFFDYGPPVKALLETGDEPVGPWLATAYPRAGSPAYATPDATGRLQVYHLLEDKWAHTYRYYIRPASRYDLFWRSLQQSALLWSDTDTALTPSQPQLPDLQQGGLDVVLDRTHPVDMPTILHAGRLDAPGSPANPATPGKRWEVIIAQHREQSLSERNQTLARQLAFRHVAYTLLRQFAYQERWDSWQNNQIASFHFTVDYPQNTTADLPSEIQVEDAKLSDQPMTADDLLSISLPQRLDNFQQGALVLQWEALPFYYKHRLLVIAQASTLVSPVNAVTQSDFEYIAPSPADANGNAHFVEGTDAIAVRAIDIPLRRLWDSLPSTTQARWPAENPELSSDAATKRRPGALPDPEVVYQIIEFFQGNIEVQAELYVDDTNGPLAQGRYTVRQLGQHHKATITQLQVPKTTKPGDNYRLAIRLDQVVESTEIVDWVSQEPVSKRVTISADPSKPPQLTTAAADNCTLVWAGSMTAEQIDALQSLKGDAAFTQAILQLINAAPHPKPDEPATSEPAFYAVAPLGPEQKPADITYTYQDRRWTGLPNDAMLELVTDQAAETYTALRWTGLLYDADKAAVLTALQKWAQVVELRTILTELFDQLDTRTLTEVYSGPTTNANIPAALQAQLQLSTDSLSWQGRVKDPAQLKALTDLASDPNIADQAFKTALTKLITRLRTEPMAVPMTLFVRPPAEALVPALKEKLVLGQAILSVTGLMSVHTTQNVQMLFDLPADQAAVARLYQKSLQKGLRSRELRVRTRRGSAPPSQMVTLTAKELAI